MIQTLNRALTRALNRALPRQRASRSAAGRGRRREHHEVREMLSLALAMLRRTILLRTPASLASLDALLDGHDTYTNYQPRRYGRVGRFACRALRGAYRFARSRADAVRHDDGFARRCEQEALDAHRRLIGREADRTDVLFTLMFVREDVYGPFPVVTSTLLRRYLYGAGHGSGLLLAPRWFHELLTVVWPETLWGSTPKTRSAGDAEAEALRAGLSPARPAAGVDLDALSKLWDPDPLGLYFDLDEVLGTLAHI